MIRKVLFIFFLFVSLAHVSYAIVDDFPVRLLVGSDTTPPSIPSSLTATAVAQTQIDLSWGASVDDFLFGGYQVFRDAVQIATTTLTTYSDSGLTANTSYTYYVTAFDNAFNYSSSSNSVSTSTFPLTPTSTPSSENTTGSLVKMELRSFVVTSEQHSVDLSWTTTRHAQFQLRWGRTTSYELGFLANQLFKKQHGTLITDLEPETVYEFELVGFDNHGRKTVLKQGQFRTADATDTNAPSNVSNLFAVKDGDDVRLSWTNPKDDDFSHIRIVRNYLFYPVGPYDGFLTYQGGSTSHTDTDAFLQSKIQYYTVFSYDKNGNISSGAVVMIKDGDVQTPIDTDDTVAKIELQFSDIEFIQKEKLIVDDSIDAEIPTTVRIAYEKLPEHLKTITVAFIHPNNPQNAFSFLLRVNKDKTFYEATIAPLVTEGVYPVSVSVFDFQTQVLVTVEGSIVVERSLFGKSAFGESPFFTTLAQQSDAVTIALGLLLFILLYILYRIIIFTKKRKQAD